jgi:sugar/nucleoside kinase (ribokinase family)
MSQIISKLRNRVPITTLKCGEKGSILITKESVIEVKGFKVDCIDPTGAGDAFTAAVIFGLSKGFTLPKTIKLANWFAAQVVTKMGSRSFPCKDDIDVFLRSTLPTI